MALTSRCPENKTEVQEASKRIGCGVDDYGNIQYMCLPNKEKTSLVEFCFNGAMGIEEKGNCLENSNGKINRYNCSSFTSGCPNTTFYKHNLYEYPACLEINTKNRCYVRDPSCPSQVPNIGQSDYKENYTTIVIVIILSGIMMILIAVGQFLYCWMRCKSNRTLRKDDGTSPYPCTNSNFNIGTLRVSKKEGNELYYKATATKDNNKVEIIFCAPLELKKEDIILVDKLEGPAVYKFISKAQQNTSEQSPSLKRFIVKRELTDRDTILRETLM